MPNKFNVTITNPRVPTTNFSPQCLSQDGYTILIYSITIKYVMIHLYWLQSNIWSINKGSALRSLQNPTSWMYSFGDSKIVPPPHLNSKDLLHNHVTKLWIHTLIYLTNYQLSRQNVPWETEVPERLESSSLASYLSLTNTFMSRQLQVLNYGF